MQNWFQTFLKPFLDIVDVVCLKLTCKRIRLDLETIYPFPKNFEKVNWIVLEACYLGRWKVAYDLLSRLRFIKSYGYRFNDFRIPLLRDKKDEYYYKEVVNYLLSTYYGKEDLNLDNICGYIRLKHIYFNANQDSDWKTKEPKGWFHSSFFHSDLNMARYLWIHYKTDLVDIRVDVNHIKSQEVLDFVMENEIALFVYDKKNRRSEVPVLFWDLLSYVLKTIERDLDNDWLLYQFIENNRYEEFCKLYPDKSHIVDHDYFYIIENPYYIEKHFQYHLQYCDRNRWWKIIYDNDQVLFKRLIKRLFLKNTFFTYEFVPCFYSIDDIDLFDKVISYSTNNSIEIYLAYRYASFKTLKRGIELGLLSLENTFCFDSINISLSDDLEFRKWLKSQKLTKYFAPKGNSSFQVFLIESFPEYILISWKFYTLDTEVLIAYDKANRLNRTHYIEIFRHFKDEQSTRYFGQKIQDAEPVVYVNKALKEGKSWLLTYILDPTNPMADKLKIHDKQKLLTSLKDQCYYHLYDLLLKFSF